MGGTAVLMSVQGVEEVRYIPLAPLSAMAVSMMARTVSFLVGLCLGGETAQAIIRRKASV